MSSQELKTFRWKCEECKLEVITTAAYQGDSRPPDWKYRKVYDCGMTGYTRTEDICGTCAQIEGEASR